MHRLLSARRVLGALTLSILLIPLSDARADTIAAGEAQGCSISAAGALTCWGARSGGSLGDGLTTGTSFDPVQVIGLGVGVTDVAMSFVGGGASGGGCAVVSGGVRCWGTNAGGRVGDGTTTPRSTPFAVPGLQSGVTRVGVHAANACALQNGGLKCWGSGSGGRLGHDSAQSSFVPVTPVGMGSGVTDFAVGARHMCAIKGGTVSCWGDNTNGQLGYTGPYSTPYRYVPRPITGAGTDETPMTLPAFTRIAAGSDISCAVAAGSGEVWCWGANNSGQLGNGTTGSGTYVPQRVSGLSGVTDVSVNSDTACAIRSGSVLCWGNNHYGQLGNGVPWQPVNARSNVPVAVVGLTGVTSIATANSHTCATAGGQAWCWGSNQHGKLGNEAAGAGSTTPVRVVGGTPKRPSDPPPPPPPPADTTAPALSKASLRSGAFRATLSESAKLTITISRRDQGRRKGSRCRPATRALRKAPKCTLLTRIGTVTADATAGANRIAFANRVGKKKLKPASYEAVLVARDAAGNASKPATVRFTVKAPRKKK